VDTLSKEKFTKTIINKDPPKKSEEEMTEEERAERYVNKLFTVQFLIFKK